MTIEATRRLKKSELTRARILESARRLFNERGTAAVSTNHIAHDLGISPGNLYYHFTGKADIIRALLAEYADLYEERWDLSTDPGEDLAKLAGNLSQAAAIAWEYRFFERELRALLRTDPRLKAAYQGIYERRMDQWVSLGERLVDQGFLRPPRPPASTRDLAMSLWIIAENWLGFLDVAGDPEDPEQVAKVADLLAAVIDPNLAARGRRALRRAGVVEEQAK